MSNKLKTLSAAQLEQFISEKIGKYIGEECECEISDLNTPNIDSEADIALNDTRDLSFHVRISYKDSS